MKFASYFDGSCLSPSVAQECGIHTKQECYPLAFGIAAALMVVSLGRYSLKDVIL